MGKKAVLAERDFEMWFLNHLFLTGVLFCLYRD